MWIPTSESEILDALHRGDLIETCTFDAKAKPDKSIDIAKDVASFANDGGVIIYGIGEDQNGRITVNHPFALKGEAERVQQIARTGIAEAPDIRIIPVAKGDGTGYLVVVIPSSPRAPHMVVLQKHNRYYGRNDKESYSLSEGEVARLYQRRQRWETSVEAELNQMLSVMTLPEDKGYIQLYMAIRPLILDNSLIDRGRRSSSKSDFLNLGLLEGEKIVPAERWESPPHLVWENVVDGRVGNFATHAQATSDTHKIWVYDDGSGGIVIGDVGRIMGPSQSEKRLYLFEVDVFRTVMKALATFGHIYQKSGYLGPVNVKVKITGLNGAYSGYIESKAGGTFWPRRKFAKPFEQNIYERHTTGMGVNLNEKDVIMKIARSLLHPLFEVISQEFYKPFDENNS